MNKEEFKGAFRDTTKRMVKIMEQKMQIIQNLIHFEILN
jgi:hypothetical protein